MSKTCTTAPRVPFVNVMAIAAFSSLATSIVTADAASGATVGPKTPAAASYSQQAFDETNQQRATAQLPTLRQNRCLTRMARRQAERMANASEMFHQNLDRVVRGCGLDLTGENVAYGYPDGTSVVVDGWMESPGHRDNILEGRYVAMGMGAAQDENGRWFVAQVFGRQATKDG